MHTLKHKESVEYDYFTYTISRQQLCLAECMMDLNLYTYFLSKAEALQCQTELIGWVGDHG